jgi:hypothetical protein
LRKLWLAICLKPHLARSEYDPNCLESPVQWRLMKEALVRDIEFPVSTKLVEAPHRWMTHIDSSAMVDLLRLPLKMQWGLGLGAGQGELSMGIPRTNAVRST